MMELGEYPRSATSGGGGAETRRQLRGGVGGRKEAAPTCRQPGNRKGQRGGEVAYVPGGASPHEAKPEG